MNFEEISSKAKSDLIEELKDEIKTILSDKPHWKKKIESEDRASIKYAVSKILSTLSIKHQSEKDRLLQNRKEDGSVSQFRVALVRSFDERSGDLEDFIEDELKPLRKRKQDEYRNSPHEFNTSYENDFEYLFEWSEERILKDLARYEILNKVLGGSVNHYGTELESQWFLEEYYKLFGLKPTVFEIIEPKSGESIIEDQIPVSMKKLIKDESDWKKIKSFMIDWDFVDKDLKIRNSGKVLQGSIIDFIYFLNHQHYYKPAIESKWKKIVNSWLDVIDGLVITSGGDAFNGDSRKKMSPDKKKSIGYKFEYKEWYKDEENGANKIFPVKI